MGYDASLGAPSWMGAGEGCAIESRLVPVNAWIALHRGEGGWPRPLADQGFRIHRLEAPVGVSAAATASGAPTVVVDVISVREQPPTALLAECKAGRSIDNEQAQRYGVATARDVYRHVGLPFPPDDATAQPVYTCLSSGRAGVRYDLERLGLTFPLLAVGSGSARLEADAAAAVTGFAVAVPAGPPPRYVVVDAESPNDELLEYLVPALIAAASRGEEYVTIASLLREVVPYWDVYGAAARRQLLNRARDALRSAIERQFPSDFALEYTGQGQSLDRDIVRIISTPVRYDPRGQTQSWQRLRRRAARAVGRGPARPVPPGQQVLWEDLGLATEIAED